MQKAPPSPGHCKPLREERDGARKGSRFPQMPRPLSDGWPQRSQVPVRRTRSRQESKLRCYGGPGRISPLRSGGSRRARAFRTTRSPTSGPSPRQRSQTPEGWSAWDRGEGNATPQVSPHISSGRLQRRSGPRLGSGQELGRAARKKYKNAGTSRSQSQYGSG